MQVDYDVDDDKHGRLISFERGKPDDFVYGIREKEAEDHRRVS